ncbi:hypothetical protein AAVH_36585, partial [Aphelenchoides avenae]
TNIAEDARPTETSSISPLRLEAKELRTVYNYCRSLPTLADQNAITVDEKTRAVCDNIISLLQPMFAKERPLRVHRSTARRMFSGL